jgi:UDP-3-O-[3-hydroxymyristoyl] glucosamine N-acyltransferase
MSTSQPIAILGAGGHAAHCIEILRAAGTSELRAFDDAAPPGSTVLGVAVLGTIRDAFALASYAVVAIGSAAARKAIANEWLVSGNELVSVLHPAAAVAASAQVGRGCVLGACAVIDAHAELGDGVIVDACATVAHDARVGSWVHLESGARVLPGAVVGSSTKIGANAVVMRNAVVPEGADVPPGTVFG